MRPMFSRLHVNDTEKGGPRAPPRNKMALYEQLSVPSQRFKPGVLPLTANYSANLIPPSFSSQGNGHERGMLFPLQLPSSRNSAEKSHACSSDSNTPLTQFESRKKAVGDDTRVCTFVNSNTDQGLGKFYSNSDWERLAPSSPAYSVCPNKRSKLNKRRNTRQQKGPKQLVAIREQSVKSALSAAVTDKPVGPSEQTDVYLQYKLREDPINNVDPLHKSGTNLLPENMVDSQVGSINDDAAAIRDVEDGDSSFLMKDFRTEEQIFTINLVSDTESHEDKAYKSHQTGNVVPVEDSSETSMVNCISGVDIVPDDIVGLIGKNHFWKARRSILHQQRVFAFQVFELHRLIKVQKLIAGSPHLLLEGSAYLAKSLKGSSAKRLPLEYIVKEPQIVSKHKNDSERPNFRMEFSAENTLGKASFSSVQNGSQPPSYRPFSGNPSAAAISNDSDMGPWCFHQPSDHQGLIPVMTPSEGLVYKPYPGPGFMSPVCGGCGPLGSTPVKGHFSVPAYGVPASQHHYQGTGVPFAPPSFNGYFPPYGMPAMNPTISTSAVGEITQFARMGSQRQVSGANSNNLHWNSCNRPSQKNRAVSNVRIENELQASTASSQSERAQEVVPVVSSEMEGRSELCLSPTSPAANHSNASPRPHYIAPARVIRAVPRNARSATESAARIFQCIQEERKQND